MKDLFRPSSSNSESEKEETMDLRSLLLNMVSSKFKKERGIDLTPGEIEGKRPDALLKSGGTVLGVVLIFFDELEEEAAKRIKEFIGCGVPIYLLIQKWRQKEITDMVWKTFLTEKVKIITWDIHIGF